MDSKPPEAVEAMVLEETAHVVAQYWSATGRPAGEPPANGGQPVPGPPEPPQPDAAGNGNGNGNGGRHLRRPAPGRAGRHERRR
jgi:hypothetical protein